jgi:hypothetical protein
MAFAPSRQTYGAGLESALGIVSRLNVMFGHVVNAGTLTIASGPAASIAWKRVSETGGFGGASWDKLYDIGGRLIIVFENAFITGALWPSTREPFELTLGTHHLEAMPRAAQAVGTARSLEADLDARIAIDARQVGSLRIAARYAGYRASWTVPNEAQPGEYVQTMMAPRTLSANTRTRDKSEVTDRDAEMTGRSAPVEPLPNLAIRYRIESPAVP